MEHKVNTRKILEIADLIHVRRGFPSLKLLSAGEILQTYEYKQFAKKYPELCKEV